MNPHQRRAKFALDQLLRLGLSQKEVAGRLNVHFTAMSHINALEKEPDFYVSKRMVDGLEQMVQDRRRECLAALLAHLPVTVLETCNDAGIVVDETLRREIQRTFLSALAGKLAPDSPMVPLPAGVAGAVAALGDDMYLIKLDSFPSAGDPEGGVQHTRLLIHELEHLIQRLRSSLPTTAPYQSKSAF
jgi:hypothetical protein